MKKKVKKEVTHKHKPGFLKVTPPSFRLPRTIGQRTADWLTKWAGSWTFIIIFFVFIGIWMTTNGYFLLKYLEGGILDPYPFILLNLALSCLAAIQAPVILMSQNRDGQRDRLRAQYDYAVNRKAEKEIRDMKKQLNRMEKVMMRRKRK